MIDWRRFWKRNGVLVLVLVFAIIYTWAIRYATMKQTEKRLKAAMDAEYAEQLKAAEENWRMERSKEYFLSGEASFESALNQNIQRAAILASKMETDVQKGGIICNALARMMNKGYPSTLEEVLAQPNQWMFYDPENPYSQKDWDIAETILRPFYERGQIPNGLTSEFVYGQWSDDGDYELRNDWRETSTTKHWRYTG